MSINAGNITFEPDPDLYGVREIPTFTKLNQMVKLILDLKAFGLSHGHTGESDGQTPEDWAVGVSVLGPLKIDNDNSRIGIGVPIPTEALDVSGNVKVSGNIHAVGNITADGHIVLGDNPADELTIGADVHSHIKPNASNSWDLGLTDQRWRNLFVGDIQAATATFSGAITGNVTGNATTASAWATGRTITLTGDVTGVSGSWTGSGNISFATTISGLDVANFTSPNISQWTNDSGYLTGNQTITLSGDASGSGTTSISVVVANDSHTHNSTYYTETESDARYLLESNNLLDLDNYATARTNLVVYSKTEADDRYVNQAGDTGITGSLVPTSNAHSLGGSSTVNKWLNVYATNVYTGDLNLQNDRGDWTVIEEEDYLTLRNNKTGKMFKLLMEEVI